MMYIWIFAVILTTAFADIGISSRGGYSSSVPSGTYLPPKVNNGASLISSDGYVPKVYKHVYVHSAPDIPEDRQVRTIRVGGGDRHVNIIFVKAPSPSSSQQTEVILPEQDEHKNLVYVLLNENAAENDIKITRPAARAPEKPEVHFIKYNDQQQQQQVAGDATAPVQQPPHTPDSLYGTPAISAVAAPPPSPPSKPSGLYGTPTEALTPPRQSQSVQSPTRVYGTPEDVPAREPSGLYGLPSQ